MKPPWKSHGKNQVVSTVSTSLPPRHDIHDQVETAPSKLRLLAAQFRFFTRVLRRHAPEEMKKKRVAIQLVVPDSAK